MIKKLRDYHKKKYTNPFFRKSKSNPATRGRGFYYGSHFLKFRSLRKKLILFFLLILAGGWVYFLFYFSYFSIQKIEISGLEKISQTEIKDIIDSQIINRRFLIFQQKNIFIFNEKFAEKNINLKYALKSLRIDKKLPDTLRVLVQEKKPALIWKIGEKFYNADWDGEIIRELSGEEVQSMNQADAAMPLVYDEGGQAVNIKETVAARDLVQFIVNLAREVGERVGLKITNFRMDNRQSNLVKAVTVENWEIYFASDQNLILQVEKLNLFLKDKKEDERKKLEYVDLRFEDRVYYK